MSKHRQNSNGISVVSCHRVIMRLVQLRNPRLTSKGVLRSSIGKSARRHDHLNILVAIIFLFVLVAMQFSELFESHWRVLWGLCGAIALILILLCHRIFQMEWFSPPLAYMVIFWLFHFGLIFPAALAPGILNSFPPWYLRFFTQPEAGTAALASLIFIGSFAWGLTRFRFSPVDKKLQKGEKAPELIIAGWISISLGMAIFLSFLANHGVPAFFQSYDYFFTISNTPTSAIFVITYGLMLLTMGGCAVRMVLITGALLYLPLFVLLMMSGSRTGPLFSIVVLLVTLNLRGIRISRIWIGIGAIIVLMMTATIRDIRAPGIALAIDSPGSIAIRGPLSGMMELGGSICPVIATIEYMHTNRFLYGASYIYPFYRQVSRALGRDAGTPETDIRFIARHITKYYAAFGYSAVAEAYANGGVIGVILFAAAWGIGMQLLMRRASTSYGAALLVVVFIPMMSNIRNSFIYVPAWIFLGSIPLFVLHIFLRKRMPRCACKPSVENPGLSDPR